MARREPRDPLSDHRKPGQEDKGDTRILELLIQKDDQAVKNIGDPSALMGVYDIEEEEKITAQAIEKGSSVEQFDRFLQDQAGKTFDPLALLMGESAVPNVGTAEKMKRAMPALYKSEFDYLSAAIEFIRNGESLQASAYPQNHQIEIMAPEDLKDRFRYLPKEIWPENGYFTLSSDKNQIQQEIKRSRKDEKAWPRIHYLWPLNPVIEWANDKVISSFRRHEAPVVTLKGALEKDEVVFILSGLIPNRKSHPLIQRWFGVDFQKGLFRRIEDFEPLMSRVGLGSKTFPNVGATTGSTLSMPFCRRPLKRPRPG